MSRGIVKGWETIVFQHDDRETLTGVCIHDFLLIFCYPSRHEDSPSCRDGKATGFLNIKEAGVFSVANNGQERGV